MAGLLAEMVKCEACHILMGTIWHLGIHWLHKTGQQLLGTELNERMQAMCEILVRDTAIQICSSYWCCNPPICVPYLLVC